MAKPKAVLWDLDGTILDSLSIAVEVLAEIFPKVGLAPLKREQIRPEFHGSLEGVIAKLSNNYHDQEYLFKLFLETQIAHHENPVTHEGIHDAISNFTKHGYKQAIVTSRGTRGQGIAGAKEIIKVMKIDLHIETVVCADDTINHKPHPEPVLLALKRIGVEPENAVMIGDQPVDALAAKAAGVASILIDHEATADSLKALQDAQPTLFCTDAGQIIDGVHKLLKV